ARRRPAPRSRTAGSRGCPSCRAARGAPRAACESSHSHPWIVLRAVVVRPPLPRRAASMPPVPEARNARWKEGGGPAGSLNCHNLSPILLDSFCRSKCRPHRQQQQQAAERPSSLQGDAMNPLNSIWGTITAGVVLAVVIGLFNGVDFSDLTFIVWVHVLAGIVWIGLLYYF